MTLSIRPLAPGVIERGPALFNDYVLTPMARAALAQPLMTLDRLTTSWRAHALEVQVLPSPWHDLCSSMANAALRRLMRLLYTRLRTLVERSLVRDSFEPPAPTLFGTLAFIERLEAYDSAPFNALIAPHARRYQCVYDAVVVHGMHRQLANWLLTQPGDVNKRAAEALGRLGQQLDVVDRTIAELDVDPQTPLALLANPHLLMPLLSLDEMFNFNTLREIVRQAYHRQSDPWRHTMPADLMARIRAVVAEDSTAYIYHDPAVLIAQAERFFEGQNLLKTLDTSSNMLPSDRRDEVIRRRWPAIERMLHTLVHPTNA